MGQPAKGPVGEACKRQVQHSIENARQLLADAYSQLVPHRAAGYNHLIVHESGEIYSVEVSARRFAILYAEKMVMLLVADLTTREMHVAWGNPCNNPYHTYHLEA